MSTDMIPTEGTSLSLFSADGFELVQRMAKAFASSTLVPKHYQGAGGISNCIIALNMAQRIGSDPLMTMQNLYVVHGTPAWSAQFLIATSNTSGRFSSIRFEWQGKEGTDDWGCRALATEKESGEVLKGSLITIKLAKDEGWYAKAGSKWKTMPEQMLKYRAAAWFVRAYAPEIAMGLHCTDEVEDAHNPSANGSKVKMKSIRDITGGEPDDVPLQETESADETIGTDGKLFAEADTYGDGH